MWQDSGPVDSTPIELAITRMGSTLDQERVMVLLYIPETASCGLVSTGKISCSGPAIASKSVTLLRPQSLQGACCRMRNNGDGQICAEGVFNDQELRDAVPKERKIAEAHASKLLRSGGFPDQLCSEQFGIVLVLLPPFTVFLAATVALYRDQRLCHDIQLITESLGEIACVHALNKRRCRLGQRIFSP